MKSLYIAEKPSVAAEFAKALKISGQRRDGYLESDSAVVTWCVGHLVTMSYPEVYDIKYKKWSFDTLPFLPAEFRYEIIPGVAKQYNIVKELLNRKDVDTIYVCTDSGREGEYIYRLVAMMTGIHGKKKEKRVWIDSQTEEEILRGIREAKDESEYDNLSSAAYLRAKEDYLMGINFSRALTLEYGNALSAYLKSKYQVIAVGRVMTCVLGMVVRREREIRAFVKTPFYRVLNTVELAEQTFDGEWRVSEGSRLFQSPALYKENGFKKREDAEQLIRDLSEVQPLSCSVEEISRRKETKNPPLLFNLAELQNVCSKLFKISPDQTLQIVQDLYERKLVTYPRTDAHVLSSAVAKEINKNISGLQNYQNAGDVAREVLENGTWKNIAKTRYCNDSQITDHYAIIPTGQGLNALSSVSETAQKVYEVIVRRFLAIFYPPAVYQKLNVTTAMKRPEPETPPERFYSSFRVLLDPGYLKMASASFASDKTPGKSAKEDGEQEEEINGNDALLTALKKLKKGDVLNVRKLFVKEGETSPPKRYNSGSMILAMENAGQLIEDEDLRAQIKGAGIGTSATRAEILKKLFNIKYLNLNKKTQIITPTLLGEMIYDVVNRSIRQLLNPDLTASWEKGLNYVAEGSITEKEYMDKLEHFIRVRTNQVRNAGGQYELRKCFDEAARFYRTADSSARKRQKAGKETKDA